MLIMNKKKVIEVKEILKRAIYNEEMKMQWSSSRQMSPGNKFFSTRILPLIAVVVGIVIAFFGIQGLIRVKASLDWPSTQGKVISSSVEQNSNSKSTTYHAEILYEFDVNGTTFKGNCVSYGDYGSSNPSHAQQIVNRYPKYMSVIVHYMPGNPGESLLEPGVQIQTWFLPAAGLVFFTLGILFYRR